MAAVVSTYGMTAWQRSMAAASAIQRSVAQCGQWPANENILSITSNDVADCGVVVYRCRLSVKTHAHAVATMANVAANGNGGVTKNKP